MYTPKPVIDFECVICGARFKSTCPEAKYCSNRCRQQARKKPARQPYTKVCTICGKTYKTFASRQLTCASSKCKKARHLQRYNERMNDIPLRANYNFECPYVNGRLPNDVLFNPFD